MRSPHPLDTPPDLDRDYLLSMAQRGPEPLFACLGGDHLYGFAAPHSAVELRGVFVGHDGQDANTTWTLRDSSRMKLTWVAHGLRKFQNLLLHHDSAALEQLFSPLVALSTPAHAELRELAQACIARATVRHYQGTARSRRKRLAQPNATLPHLLHAYRALFTGIHLMRSGRVESHIETLNDIFGLQPVRALVAQERASQCTLYLDSATLAAHERALDGLEQTLHEVPHHSPLPPRVPCQARQALEAFVAIQQPGAGAAGPLTYSTPASAP